MSVDSRRPRARTRRAALLAALAGAAVGLLALLPGTAQAGLGTSTVSVQLTGTGNGSVAQQGTPPPNSSGSINCSKPPTPSDVCSVTVPLGDPPQPFIVLQANPAANSDFTGWTVSPASTPTSGCTGQNPVCYVQAIGNVTVSANFNAVPSTFPVTVNRQGTAASQGSVVSQAPNTGINCSPTDQIDCSHAFTAGASVTFVASAPAGVTFAGWGGACAAAGTNPVCTLGINAPTFIVANFNVATQTVTASVNGDGGVSSNIQPGISCSGPAPNTGTCSAQFGQNEQVSFNAHAASGWQFQSWGGSCAGTAATAPCVLTIGTSPINIQATFVQTTVQANVTGNKVIYRNRAPRRVLQVKLNAQEEVNVRLQLQRGGQTFASRRFNNVGPGNEVLSWALRNAIPSGRYTLVVTMTNDFGTSKQQNRNVKLKPARR